MDLGIAGKWALVCGASKGLGYGCARALAGEGVGTVELALAVAVVLASVLIGAVPAWRAYRNTLADGLTLRV